MKQLRFIGFCVLLSVYPILGFAQFTWTSILSPTTNDLYAVSFADSLVGTAVGANGTIIRTTDSGLHWAVQESAGVTMRDVKMKDVLTAIAVGDAGTILLSTNGGVSWQQRQDTIATNLYTVAMVHNDTGWIGGSLSNVILHTTDGWISWTSQFTEIGSVLHIACANANVCMANNTAYISKTTNGGQTWIRIGYAPGVGNIQFIDADTSIGSGAFIHSGTLVRTTDGGYNWDVKYYTGNGNYIYDLKLSDSRKGIAVGENGTIVYTDDRGVSWTAQQSGTSQPLYGASIAGNSFVVVGRGGIILHTNDTTVVSIDQEINTNTPKNFKLLQNYPNPFNPKTIIKYTVPTSQLTSLFIYNLLGQQVITLVNEVKQAGEYSIGWDASNMPGGIYLYELRAGPFVAVKKMVLLK